MKIAKICILITLCALTSVSCREKKKPGKWTDTTSSGVIEIAVDDSFQPIMDTQIAVFETIYKGAGIIPIYTNEVEVLDMLFNDSVRFAMVSRNISEAERAQYKAKNRIVREMLIAWDAVALIVNKSNPDSLISVKDLRGILTGKITKWSELNPQSTLKGDINVVFDHTRSGILRYAVDSICRGEKLTTNAFAEKRNKEVLDYVAQSPHALGLIGVNWVGNESDSTRLSFDNRVTVMAVSKFDFPNEENSYQPYQAYIANGWYPLVRPVYALLNDPKGGLSTGFMTFLWNQRGQKIILKSGLVPATQDLRLVNITK